jgi:hypothetical protein
MSALTARFTLAKTPNLLAGQASCTVPMRSLLTQFICATQRVEAELRQGKQCDGLMSLTAPSDQRKRNEKLTQGHKCHESGLFKRCPFLRLVFEEAKY